MVRTIVAVLIGILVGGLLVAVVELIGHLIYPPSPGLDTHDPAAIKAYMEVAPIGALLMVIAAWTVGVSGGTWVAGRVAAGTSLVPVFLVGGFFEVVTVATLVMLPHPLWFTIVSPCLVLLAALVGALLARRPAAA